MSFPCTNILMGSHHFQVKCNMSAIITQKNLHELASFYFSGQIISHSLILIFCTLVINILANPSTFPPMQIAGSLSTSPHITLYSDFFLLSDHYETDNEFSKSRKHSSLDHPATVSAQSVLVKESMSET